MYKDVAHFPFSGIGVAIQNHLSEGLTEHCHIVTSSLQKAYRYCRLDIASLSVAFNKHPSVLPNIRIAMGDSTLCYIHDH